MLVLHKLLCCLRHVAAVILKKSTIEKGKVLTVDTLLLELLCIIYLTQCSSVVEKVGCYGLTIIPLIAWIRYLPCESP